MPSHVHYQLKAGKFSRVQFEKINLDAKQIVRVEFMGVHRVEQIHIK